MMERKVLLVLWVATEAWISSVIKFAWDKYGVLNQIWPIYIWILFTGVIASVFLLLIWRARPEKTSITDTDH